MMVRDVGQAGMKMMLSILMLQDIRSFVMLWFLLCLMHWKLVSHCRNVCRERLMNWEEQLLPVRLNGRPKKRFIRLLFRLISTPQEPAQLPGLKMKVVTDFSE